MNYYYLGKFGELLFLWKIGKNKLREVVSNFSTSEVTRHKARFVLGWGTAREVMWRGSAFANMIMAAWPTDV